MIRDCLPRSERMNYPQRKKKKKKKNCANTWFSVLIIKFVVFLELEVLIRFFSSSFLFHLRVAFEIIKNITRKKGKN